MGKKPILAGEIPEVFSMDCRKFQNHFLEVPPSNPDLKHRPENKRRALFQNSHRVVGGFFINILKHLFPPFL